jgi:hypothetical protein
MHTLNHLADSPPAFSSSPAYPSRQRNRRIPHSSAAVAQREADIPGDRCDRLSDERAGRAQKSNLEGYRQVLT